MSAGRVAASGWSGPASISRILRSGSSLRRDARVQPADPPPTTMTSNFIAKRLRTGPCGARKKDCHGPTIVPIGPLLIVDVIHRQWHAIMNLSTAVRLFPCLAAGRGCGQAGSRCSLVLRNPRMETECVAGTCQSGQRGGDRRLVSVGKGHSIECWVRILCCI